MSDEEEIEPFQDPRVPFDQAATKRVFSEMLTSIDSFGFLKKHVILYGFEYAGEARESHHEMDKRLIAVGVARDIENAHLIADIADQFDLEPTRMEAIKEELGDKKVNGLALDIELPTKKTFETVGKGKIRSAMRLGDLDAQEARDWILAVAVYGQLTFDTDILDGINKECIA